MKTYSLGTRQGYKPKTAVNQTAFDSVTALLTDGPATRAKINEILPKGTAPGWFAAMVQEEYFATNLRPHAHRLPIELAQFDALLERNRELMQLNEGLTASQLSRDEFITLWGITRDRLSILFDNDDLCLEHQQERYAELLSVYRRLQVMIDGLELAASC